MGCRDVDVGDPETEKIFQERDHQGKVYLHLFYFVAVFAVSQIQIQGVSEILDPLFFSEGLFFQEVQREEVQSRKDGLMFGNALPGARKRCFPR